MLLQAFTDRVDATTVLAGAVAGAGGTVEGTARFDDVALLAATSMVFGLGAASVEQVKH